MIGLSSLLSYALSALRSLTTKFSPDRHIHRRRIGLCRVQLWLWPPCILYQWPLHKQAQILFIRRMDTDLCDINVDKDIHMSLPVPHSSNEVLEKTSLHCRFCAFYFQFSSHAFVDLTMSSGTSDLGLDSSWAVLYTESATADHPSSRQ